MTTTTKHLFGIMRVLSWIIFIGLCYYHGRHL